MTTSSEYEPKPTTNPEILIQPDYIYRSGEIADATAIQLVIERAIAARKGDPIPSRITKPDYIRQNEELLSKESTWSRLVFNGDMLIGLTIGIPSTDLSTGEIIPNKQHLVLLMVDPEHWRKGIGSNLLDWVDNDMTRRRVESIELWTGIDNHRSRALYERKGYRATGIESTQYGRQVQYEKYL